MNKYLEKLKEYKNLPANENEYWERHKVFKKAIGNLTLKATKMFSNPVGYIEEFEIIMEQGVRTGIIDIDYANAKRKQLYEKLNDPAEFKEWTEKKIKIIKRKFGKKLGL